MPKISIIHNFLVTYQINIFDFVTLYRLKYICVSLLCPHPGDTATRLTRPGWQKTKKKEKLNSNIFTSLTHYLSFYVFEFILFIVLSIYVCLSCVPILVTQLHAWHGQADKRIKRKKNLTHTFSLLLHTISHWKKMP